MRDYETTILMRTNLDEAELEKEIQAVESGITSRGGEMVLVERWGKRRLAYEIERQHDGYYVMFRYAATAEVPAELENRFRINERLLRYLTVIADTPRPRPIEASPEGEREDAVGAGSVTSAAPVESDAVGAGSVTSAAPAESDAVGAGSVTSAAPAESDAVGAGSVTSAAPAESDAETPLETESE